MSRIASRIVPTLGCEERNSSLETVRKLLAERNELLRLYETVAGVAPFSTTDSRYTLELQRLCQLLTDYLAAGQFRIYNRVLTGNERRTGVRRTAARHYPAITRTTRHALAFADQYASGESPQINHVSADLSSLGMVLAERIEREDQVLQAMCNTLAPVSPTEPFVPY